MNAQTSQSTPVEYRSIPAPALGPDKTVTVAITTPSGVDPTAKELPLAIFLHGWGGSARSWAQLDGPQLLNRLVSTGVIPPLVVAAPDGQNSGWINWKENDSEQWAGFLHRDLLAALDALFSIEGRAILGASMGGVGALLAFFKQPDLYDCVAAHSAALHPADPADLPQWAQNGFRDDPEFHSQYAYPIDKAHWQNNNVLHLARKTDIVANTRPRIYFDAGVDDHLDFARTNAQLSQLLAERAISHLFGLRPGGHGDEYTRSNLSESLRFIGSYFRRIG